MSPVFTYPVLALPFTPAGDQVFTERCIIFFRVYQGIFAPRYQAPNK
jgi:hypothetical protein